MIVGGAATVVSLLALAWVKELIGGLLWILGVDTNSTGAGVTIIVVATILMYCVDIAINTGKGFPPRRIPGSITNRARYSASGNTRLHR